MPSNIIDFIKQNHVVSFACSQNDELWAASCFYVFDEENHRLIILSKKTTLHGQMMLSTPQIAGTISGQPENVKEIEGIQFQAITRCLEQKQDKEQAEKLYFARHPIAKLMPSDLWEIRFTKIKHTENRLSFAHKTIWEA